MGEGLCHQLCFPLLPHKASWPEERAEPALCPGLWRDLICQGKAGMRNSSSDPSPEPSGPTPGCLSGRQSQAQLDKDADQTLLKTLLLPPTLQRLHPPATPHAPLLFHFFKATSPRGPPQAAPSEGLIFDGPAWGQIPALPLSEGQVASHRLAYLRKGCKHTSYLTGQL